MNKKTVLITGSTGLAASLAEKFSMNNYNVIITYIFHEKVTYFVITRYTR